MKAKQVYEFIQNKSLKKTIGPIGQDYLLEKKFNEWIYKNKLEESNFFRNKLYKFENNTVIFENNLNLSYRYITDIPFNLKVLGYLDLSYSKFTNKNLEYNIYCYRLDIRSTQIKSIRSLYIDKLENELSSGFLFASANISFRSITEKSYIGHIGWFDYSNLKFIPKDTYVGQTIFLKGTPLVYKNPDWNPLEYPNINNINTFQSYGQK